MALIGLSAWNGQLGVKALVIGVGSAVVVFGLVAGLLYAYRVSGA